MSKKFLTSIDLHKNELQNAVVHSLVTAPASGTAGQIYYNSTDKKLYQHDGTSWVCVGIAYALGTGTPSSNTVPITLSANGQVQDTITIAGAGGATLSFSNGTLTITTADNNTTYTFTGAASSTAYVITCTPSSGTAQTVTIPLADGTNAGLMSPSEYTKLSGIESGAQKNVQGDFNQSDSSADDFIKNKPTIINYDTGTASDLSTGTSTTAKVWTPKVIHDHVAGASPVQTNENTTPYQFRPTPQCGSIEYLDQVVGGTLAVNQLVKTTDTEVTVTSGHKYLSKINDVQTVAQSNGTSIAINDGTNDNVFDLTQMFGTTIADYVYNLEQSTAGSGVAWLRQYYPSIFNSYQPYNAGTLESVEASEHRTIGFNQLNIEDFATAYPSYCSMVDDDEMACTTYSSLYYNGISVNFKPIHMTYEVKCGTATGVRIKCVFEDGYSASFSSSSSTTYVKRDLDFSGAFTNLHGNLVSVRLDWSGTGTFWIKNLCANVSAPEKSGTYERYVENVYPLDSDLVLRGIPKLNNGVPYYDGDEYKSDGTVTRKYGVVDLGTLNWTYDSQYVRFYAVLNTAKQQSAWNADIVCAKYVGSSVSGSDTSNDKVIGTYDGYLYVRDKSYTDAPTFKASVNNVYAVYELKTYSTESADPYNRVQKCYMDGTEEFVSSTVIPVGHTTYYPLTLKDTMPTSNGTYTLSLTVADGKPTLSWS